MSVRALLRAILLAVLVAATCQADETTSDYSTIDSTDRPESTEEEQETNKSATPNQGLKPTKYHYYPHNQHIYLLPECAVQQVCNAVYVRLNYTQPLCACPSRYKEPCSASLNADDLHTTELSTDTTGKILTLVKTCEPVAEMRTCRSPRDWSLLALQNVRTGKSHYLVICRCPHTSLLEGPMSHDQPTYASVPGIRVYGMMCVTKNGGGSSHQTTLAPPLHSSPAPITKRRARPLRTPRSLDSYYRSSSKSQLSPPFPWRRAMQFIKSVQLEESLKSKQS
ncbi:uncharacterized protein LOC114120585 isoform X1 [Aphis gossypii]|uniref:uncharacterized protein LOC114120585 isoform X1 n=1 Tax=Aphis gossypii TaxID=80765 RepID=UPI00100FDB80|nr:uncharacterized protein LOC114120585 isoform X1 [Aphis gossypii]